MPISCLNRAEIDTSKWDRCVNSCSSTATVFAQHWFLDMYCQRWEAVVMDDYRAVLPLPIGRKFGTDYVYPPFFAYRLGFFGEKLTQKEIDMMLDLVAKKFKWADLVFGTNIQYKKGNTSVHQSYILELKSDYETIREGYHENHRRNCKKGRGENLELVFDASPKEIIELFKNNRGKSSSVGYKESDYEELLNIISFLREKKTVEIVGVRNSKGVLCAGAFFPFWREKYCFLFSGRKADKQSQSLYFLLDNFIFRHAGSAISLDFNGSNNPDVARFYAGFGAKKITFSQLIVNRLNCIQKLALFFKRKIVGA